MAIPKNCSCLSQGDLRLWCISSVLDLSIYEEELSSVEENPLGKKKMRGHKVRKIFTTGIQCIMMEASSESKGPLLCDVFNVYRQPTIYYKYNI
jgi:hypothetical protein